ncbi:hypothetical protein GCM10009682_55910 [Luedemannella flava]|uniref:DUF2169 domain-containing protein n=1 Tax=Luedemannella flava TaxID=349316 RepID=A0ABN2MK94_9ACTN
MRDTASPPAREMAPPRAVLPHVLDDNDDTPLLAPVTRQLSWERVHELSQTPRHHAGTGPDAEQRLITRVRRTATVQRGTRMKKIFTAAQLPGFLAGRLISGFCYRSTDLADLRTAADLSILTGAQPAPGAAHDVVFVLRWRATDPIDYDIPFAAPVDDLPAYPGLTNIPPHERIGPPVLGTGFAPSRQHLIPEFVTTDLADLPLPANSTIVAHTAAGDEVPLYSYLPEQRAWLRLFGPQWRNLLAGAPGLQIDQEYVATNTDAAAPTTRLVGHFHGELYDALADPPHEFRVLARGRAPHFLLETLARRTCRATWRGVPCTVVRTEGDWLRLRISHPDAQSILDLGAQCVERGIYEVWAPLSECADLHETETPYPL